MNGNYRINATYAVLKAKDAVKSWEDALAVQIKKGDAEGITFCTRFLNSCQKHLAKVRESVKHEHIWN